MTGKSTLIPEMNEFSYQGKELEIFEQATVWKEYFSGYIRPFLRGRVLEVGAGIGSTTTHLCDGTQTSWSCLEPDPDLFRQLEEKIRSKDLPSICQALNVTLEGLPDSESFDAILYIDVIEHIENDRKEIKSAMGKLNTGGYLIILAPAHQFVFSKFDRAIGHYRRYNKKMLRAIIPKGMNQKKLFYLDSTGLLASIVNRYVLKQDYPGRNQIAFWDKILVRISKFTDLLTFYRAGKSLIGIWQKS